MAHQLHNAELSGISAALQQGLGLSVLAKCSIPPELTIVRDKSLPGLGSVNICLFQQGEQPSQASQALAVFIKARIRLVG